MNGFYNISEDVFKVKSKDTKKVFKKMEKCEKKAYELYLNELIIWQMTIAPLQMNNHIIVKNKSKAYYSESELLAEVIIANRLSNKIMKDKLEKKYFFETIKQDLLNKTKELITNREFIFLIMAMTNLEYNFYLSFPVLDSINSDYDEKDYDEFCGNLIRTVRNSKIVNSVDENKIYLDVQTRLSIDKRALQRLIQIIVSKGNINIPYRVNFDDIEVKYIDLLRTLKALIVLEKKYSDSLEGPGIKEAITITDKGEIICKNDEVILNNAKRYISSMKRGNEIFQSGEINVKYDFVAKKYYGVSIGEISDVLLKKLANSKIKNDSYLIASYQIWKELFISEVGICDKDANKILEILRHNRTEEIESKIFEDINNRALRNPLIEIGGYLVCPFGLLISALVGHCIDILNGESQVEEVNYELAKQINKRNNEFENQIVDYLKKEMNIKYATDNIEQNSIISENGQVIRIPRQIDVIFYHNKKIYVVEAKNSSLKYTPKTIANDVNRFSKYKKNSHQYKLEEKVNSVKQNLKHVLFYLGMDTNTVVEKVEGCFITKHMTQSCFRDDLKYPIYNINEIENLLA